VFDRFEGHVGRFAIVSGADRESRRSAQQFARLATLTGRASITAPRRIRADASPA